MGGNHDWWEKGLLKDLGIAKIPSPYSTIIDGLKFYLHHGDGIAAQDWKYRAMRKIIRSKWTILPFSFIHPDISRKLVSLFSYSSRRVSQEKPDYSPAYELFIKARLEEGYDAVIMGHTHIPAFKKYPDGIYINTGDWLKHFTYCKLAEGEIELCHWTDGKDSIVTG